MRHLARMLDQALHCAEGFREHEELGCRGHTQRLISTAAKREADHSAEVAHLLSRGPMARVIGELRIEDAFDRTMSDQQIDDRSRICAMSFHAHCQRLHATQYQIAVE